MKSIVIFGIFMLFFLLSCKDNDKKGIKSNVKVIEFDPRDLPKEKEKLDNRDFSLTDIEVIKLGSQTIESLIAAPDGVLFTKEFVYLTDKTNELSISIFSRDGNFFRKISKKGGGNDEYISINDVKINQENGNIEVLANNGKKMLYYDSLGVFKKSYAMRYSGLLNFFPFKSNNYFYNTLQVFSEESRKEGLGHRLIVTKDNNPNDIKYSYLPFFFNPGKEPNATISSNNFVKLTKDTVILFEAIGDTIYNITEQGLNPRFLLKYKGDEFNKLSILEDKTILEKTRELRARKVTILIDWLENSNFVWLCYNHFSSSDNSYIVRNAIYNKKTDQTIVFPNYSRLLVSLYGLPFHLNSLIVPTFLSDDGKFVTVVQPTKLLSLLNIEKQSNNLAGPIHKLFERFKLQNLKEEDNPVLLLYNLSLTKHD